MSKKKSKGFSKGHVPWNKGKTMSNSKQISRLKEQVKESKEHAQAGWEMFGEQLYAAAKAEAAVQLLLAKIETEKLVDLLVDKLDPEIDTCVRRLCDCVMGKVCDCECE